MSNSLIFQRKDVIDIRHTSSLTGAYFVVRVSPQQSFRATRPVMNALFNAQPDDKFVAKKKRIYWYIEEVE